MNEKNPPRIHVPIADVCKIADVIVPNDFDFISILWDKLYLKNSFWNLFSCDAMLSIRYCHYYSLGWGFCLNCKCFGCFSYGRVCISTNRKRWRRYEWAFRVFLVNFVYIHFETMVTSLVWWYRKFIAAIKSTHLQPNNKHTHTHAHSSEYVAVIKYNGGKFLCDSTDKIMIRNFVNKQTPLEQSHR